MFFLLVEFFFFQLAQKLTHADVARHAGHFTVFADKNGARFAEQHVAFKDDIFAAVMECHRRFRAFRCGDDVGTHDHGTVRCAFLPSGEVDLGIGFEFSRARRKSADGGIGGALVGVAVETFRQIETSAETRDYKGFLN